MTCSCAYEKTAQNNKCSQTGKVEHRSARGSHARAHARALTSLGAGARLRKLTCSGKKCDVIFTNSLFVFKYTVHAFCGRAAALEYTDFSTYFLFIQLHSSFV